MSIPEEAKAILGKESSHIYEVTKRDIKRFAQAIGDDNPLYYDEQYAKTTRYEGIIAPPLFCHSCAFDDVPIEQLREDGLPDELNLPLPTTRAVGGGSVFEVGEVIRPGDTLTITKKVKDIYTKTGKSGTLYFTVLETTVTNQKGEVVARETASFIQR